MKGLLSKEYAASRRALIDPDKAIEGAAPAGNPRQIPTTSLQQQIAYATSGAAVPAVSVEPVEDGHTTYLTVVDKDRNMVSLTSSLLSMFGSGHVVEGAGFVLNNRMDYYWLDEADVNVLKPGKRVRQTINPAMALTFVHIASPPNTPERVARTAARPTTFVRSSSSIRATPRPRERCACTTCAG